MDDQRRDSEDQETSGERSALKLFHGTQVSLEKIRIQVGNRISALDRGDDSVDDPVLAEYRALHTTLEDFEKRFEKLMTTEAETFPVYDAWLRHVKGIGPGLSAQLLAMLLPPLVDRGPSTWYKAGGLTPSEIDGQQRLPRPRAGGDKITYYPRLRRTLFLVATSFVRNGGYYRDQYDRHKTRLAAKHANDPNWPPHRLDATARWATVKLFLSHLWEEWLKAEGKSSDRRPYVIEVLGHTTYIAPPQPRRDGKKI